MGDNITLSIRMPNKLHRVIKARADRNQRSLNAEVVFRLKHSYGILPVAIGETESLDSTIAVSEAQIVSGADATRPASAD